MTTDPVEQVREIWRAYHGGGLDALREVVPPDVEWVPLGPPADEISVTVHGYEQHGSCVLAHGSLRMFRSGGFVDVQPSWVYFFRSGKLRRCVGYPTREDALSAISDHHAEA